MNLPLHSLLNLSVVLSVEAIGVTALLEDDLKQAATLLPHSLASDLQRLK